MSEIYTDPPQSRNEAIIKATIDGTEYTAPPQSRMEDLLLELKEAIEHGGGGTSDYSQLSNKPSINDVELSGNKTSSDLGLMPEYEVDNTPTEDSDNLISSGGVWNADKNINNKLQGSKQASSTSGTIEIPDYGMTESIDMYFKPTQDLHGYDKPWAGGAGKNKLPLVLSDIKSANTSGTWSGNTYTLNGITFEVLTDDGGNVIGIVADGTATANVYFDLVQSFNSTEYAGMLASLSGAVSGVWIRISASNRVALQEIYGADTEIVDNGDNLKLAIRVSYNESPNTTIRPMIRLSTETDADFEPYANICPISGQDNATFKWTDSHDDDWELSMNFGNTYYGGYCQFNGQIYSEWDYISGSSVSDLTSLGATTGMTEAGLLYIAMAEAGVAVDNDKVATSDQLICNNLENVSAITNWTTNTSGVCLNSANNLTLAVKDITTQADMDTWLSNNPIQIAYRKKTPSYVRVTPPANLNLTDDYPIQFNGWLASVTYQPKNTVLAEAKKYTNQEIAKLGLPQPPTTDGTYHLECSVSSGIPTITWVLNS